MQAKKIVPLSSVLSGATLALLLLVWRGGAQNMPTPIQTSLVLGQPFPGLNDDQKNAFEEGLKAFSEVETPEEGLGPVFNGTSCAECHKAGAIGGAGLDLT